jgi:hypothetical protein
MTHPNIRRDETSGLSEAIVGAMLMQTKSRWQDEPEPIWADAKYSDWFDIILPLAGRRSATASVEMRAPVNASKVAPESSTTARLRAFHDWLDSLPPVPHIPLEALDREHLY